MRKPSRWRRWAKRLLFPLLRAWYGRYGRQTRRYRFRDLRLTVLPGVFHPGLFFSTGVLMRFLEKQPLQDLSLLEIGSGSGAVSCWAARLGAKVTALDINPAAVACTRQNALENSLSLQVLTSDLLDELPPRRFDRVVVNPPYYPRTPQNDAEKAFFCGENFEFFEKLARQLPTYLSENALVWMILSEDCALEPIEQFFVRAGFSFRLVHREAVWGEDNFVFLLEKK